MTVASSRVVSRDDDTGDYRPAARCGNGAIIAISLWQRHEGLAERGRLGLGEHKARPIYRPALLCGLAGFASDRVSPEGKPEESELRDIVTQPDTDQRRSGVHGPSYVKLF